MKVMGLIDDQEAITCLDPLEGTRRMDKIRESVVCGSGGGSGEFLEGSASIGT